MKARIQQHDAAELADGYSRWFRAFETTLVGVHLVCWVLLAWRVALPALPAWWMIPIAFIGAYITADLISGIVHWACDTWGTPSTPIVGKAFIRTFREHHVDQLAITRHDFVEANGSNFTLGALFPIIGLVLTRNGVLLTPARAVFCWYLLFLASCVACTSQVHKWAHMKQPPRFIAWLQRYNLTLSPEHHARHHTAPYESHYFITNGWMNWPFDHFKLFRFMERVISAVTGAIPRNDDIGEAAARELIEKERKAAAADAASKATEPRSVG